jgi:tripeptide aminopeptidase
MVKEFLKNAEQLLLELLAIPGVSCRERAVMDYLAAKLQAAGVPAEALMFDQVHRRSPHGGEVGNLVCKLPGTLAGPRRMLMAHADTVPICEGSRPLVRGDFIVSGNPKTGLGADDRSGTAVILATALEIITRRLDHPPLCFLWTVQEEIGLAGSRFGRLGLLGRPRLAFNFDGGPSHRLTIGATGGYRMTVTIRGIASHAGVAPQRGVSAITIAAVAIETLRCQGWLGRIEKNGRLGTSNVGTIVGGEASNVVAPLAVMRVEARSHEPAFRRRIVRAIETAFRQAVRTVKNVEGQTGTVEFEGGLDYEAFKLPDGDPSAALAERVIRGLGVEPVRTVSNGGLDANWLVARGIPTVTLGCGQINGHTPAEQLDRREFRKACRIALGVALTPLAEGASIR